MCCATGDRGRDTVLGKERKRGIKGYLLQFPCLYFAAVPLTAGQCGHIVGLDSNLRLLKNQFWNVFSLGKWNILSKKN